MGQTLPFVTPAKAEVQGGRRSPGRSGFPLSRE